MNNIKKTKNSFKSDTCIKMNKTSDLYYVSIKSKSCSNPSILNHSTKNANVFKSGALKDSLMYLDILVEEYIEKRKNKIIGEDVELMQLTSMSAKLVKKSVIDCLIYFVFNGTGKSESKIHANSILYYDNEYINFIVCKSYEEKYDYICNLLDSCVMSLRDKGMPTIINDFCKPWIYEDLKQDGTIKYKGSLHIRIK